MPPLSAEGAAFNADIVRDVLTMRATVYGRTAGTGPFNLVLRADLACRLEQVSRQPAATSSARRELAALGAFRFDASYDMPAGAQLAVDAFPGIRWNIVVGSEWPDDVPGIGVVGKTLDCVKAA